MAVKINPFVTEEEAEKRRQIKDCRGRQIHQRDIVVLHAGHGCLKEAMVHRVNADDPRQVEISGVGKVATDRVAVVY